MKLFFDLDGTLSDIAPRHYHVYQETVEACGGRPLPQLTYWGLKRKQTNWQLLLEMSEVSQSIEAQFLEQFAQKIEDPAYLSYDVLFPGIKPMLAQLQAKTHTMYLVSLRRHPDRLKHQLKDLGIFDYFTEILSGHSESEGADVKIKLISDNLQGDEAVIIGDTEADILAGKKLGLVTVAVTSGIRDKEFLRELKPDYLLKNVTDLQSLKYFA